MVSFRKTMIKKFLKYGIGGGIAFIVSFFSTYVLTDILHFYYLFSAIFSYFLSIFINFLFQSFITFQEKTFNFYKFILFLSHQLLGLLMFSGLIYLFTEKLSIYYLISFVLSSIIVYLFNFTMSNFIVFRKSKF
jgi:putative flippase GtrA